MSLDHSISSLIGDIYRYVGDPVGWERVLRQILALTNSRLLLLSAVDLRVGAYLKAFSVGPDESRFGDGMAAYAEEWHHADPLLQFAVQNPTAGFASISDALSASGENQAGLEYVRWSKDVLSIGNGVVRYTPQRDFMTLGFSMHPSAERGVHDAGEHRLFLMLFEHIEKAMHLAFRPIDFEDRQSACLLVDMFGRVKLASEGAQSILRSDDGLFMARGYLRATDAAGCASIDRAVTNARDALIRGGSGGVVAVKRPSGKRPWLLKVSALPHPHESLAAFAPVALIRIIDVAATPHPDAPSRWAKAFSLTPAETRLIAALMSSEDDLPHVADQLGMRHSTARVHLRHVFDKTGVRSQVALVRLLQKLEG